MKVSNKSSYPNSERSEFIQNKEGPEKGLLFVAKLELY